MSKPMNPANRSTKESLTYQNAGVDIAKAKRFVKTIKKITKEAPRSGVGGSAVSIPWT
jgi:phosphoribosylaminoimidazole (AIR) synthetase